MIPDFHPRQIGSVSLLKSIVTEQNSSYNKPQRRHCIVYTNKATRPILNFIIKPTQRHHKHMPYKTTNLKCNCRFPLKKQYCDAGLNWTVTHEWRRLLHWWCTNTETCCAQYSVNTSALLRHVVFLNRPALCLVPFQCGCQRDKAFTQPAEPL